MNDFIIRTAHESEAAQIAKVQVETWQYAYNGHIPQNYLNNLSIKERTHKWKEILTNQISINKTFVAEVDNKIVGFCSVGESRENGGDNKTGELLAIYVDQNFMHKGIGSALMKESLDYLKKHGFIKSILWF